MTKIIEARQVDTLLNDIAKNQPSRFRAYRKARRRASILAAIDWVLRKVGL
jgi:hypothetical protein